MSEFIYKLDFAILDFIRENLTSPVLDKIFAVITSLGNGGILWIGLSAIFLCFKKTRRMGVSMAISLLVSLFVTNLTLKPLVNRARPYVRRPVTLSIDPPSSASFPSGHASGSFCAALALYRENKKAGIPAIILATLIAYSRLYFYVHYFTDVLGGFLVGVLGTVAASLLTPVVFATAEKLCQKLTAKKG